MKVHIIIMCIPTVLIILTSCGGANFRAGNEWDPNEAPFFDDGMDIVSDYSELSGKWAFEQERLFDGRLQLADLVAIVNIKSLQTASGIEGQTAKRIDVKIVRTLYGESPDETLQLWSAKEAMGHELILRYESRLTGKFLLFIRWFKDENKALKHHFHLSPASQKLIDELVIRLDERKDEEAASGA